MKGIWALSSLSCLLLLVGCGVTSQQSQNGDPPALAGNWQFAMVAPSDGSFTGGLQGAFLLRNSDTVSGAGVYALWLPGDNSKFCSSGSAPITGKIAGQNVTLTAVAGGQTFTLTGSLSADGSTMMGTYASTADSSVSAGGGHCGTAQTGVHWSARSVPSLSGDVSGFFHNVGGQVFPLTGSLMQGDNIGASSAMVTGTLTFQNFFCLGSSSHQTVNVTGQISGTSVILQIIADSGLNIGQIGESFTPADLSGSNSRTKLSPVLFESLASGGNVLHGTSGYGVSTKACPGSEGAPAEVGNVCLALGNAKDCTQPISISPGALEFTALPVGAEPISQTITLTNTDLSGSTQKGLSLSLSPAANSFGVSSTNSSDFNGLPSFTEVDTCAGSLNSPFDLAPQQSCVITVSFSPQQSCTWLPIQIGGAGTLNAVRPALCPPNLRATVATPPALGATLTVKRPLTVIGPDTLDPDTSFSVPISGIGLSAVVPSVPELDFGPEALSEASTPQVLSFTNRGTHAVQILPAAISPCAAAQLLTLQQPVQSGEVSGLLVVQGNSLDVAHDSNGSNTVRYTCDIDLVSGQPNFQISSDACTGKVLAVGESCTLNITYVPQPQTDTSSGLDYFLQLNTLQCAKGVIQPNCEIDSGRFPVELKANPKSPLRMFPGAGLDFGIQTKGTASTPLTIRLSNDANDPLSASVQLKGNVTTGDYTERDDCGGTLAPGGSCTLTVVFTPQTTGFDPGTLTITYLIPGSTALPGSGTQTVSLRGTGQ